MDQEELVLLLQRQRKPVYNTETAELLLSVVITKPRAVVSYGLMLKLSQVITVIEQAKDKTDQSKQLQLELTSVCNTGQRQLH